MRERKEEKKLKHRLTSHSLLLLARVWAAFFLVEACSSALFPFPSTAALLGLRKKKNVADGVIVPTAEHERRRAHIHTQRDTYVCVHYGGAN